MPPLSLPTGQSRLSSPQSSNSLVQFPEILLLALATASCIRLAVVCLTRRKSRMSDSKEQLQEKGNLAAISQSEKKSKSSPVESLDVQLKTPPKSSPVPSPQSESPRLDELPPRFKPIYPWTCPPQPLPGPYDPRLYPLPTLRRHSSTEAESDESQEITTMDYTRRVSTNSIPPQISTFHGTITTSSNNWRRNHWVVTGG